MTTNVTRITNACLKYGFVPNNQKQTIKGFTLLPLDYLCPKLKEGRGLVLTENTLTIHHFAGSWIERRDRMKRNVAHLLGGGRITRLIIKVKRFLMRKL